MAAQRNREPAEERGGAGGGERAKAGQRRHIAAGAAAFLALVVAAACLPKHAGRSVLRGGGAAGVRSRAEAGHLDMLADAEARSILRRVRMADPQHDGALAATLLKTQAHAWAQHEAWQLASSLSAAMHKTGDALSARAVASASSLAMPRSRLERQEAAGVARMEFLGSRTPEQEFRAEHVADFKAGHDLVPAVERWPGGKPQHPQQAAEQGHRKAASSASVQGSQQARAEVTPNDNTLAPTPGQGGGTVVPHAFKNVQTDTLAKKTAPRTVHAVASAAVPTSIITLFSQHDAHEALAKARETSTALGARPATDVRMPGPPSAKALSQWVRSRSTRAPGASGTARRRRAQEAAASLEKALHRQLRAQLAGQLRQGQRPSQRLRDVLHRAALQKRRASLHKSVARPGHALADSLAGAPVGAPPVEARRMWHGELLGKPSSERKEVEKAREDSLSKPPPTMEIVPADMHAWPLRSKLAKASVSAHAAVQSLGHDERDPAVKIVPPSNEGDASDASAGPLPPGKVTITAPTPVAQGVDGVDVVSPTGSKVGGDDGKRESEEAFAGPLHLHPHVAPLTADRPPASSGRAVAADDAPGQHSGAVAREQRDRVVRAGASCAQNPSKIGGQEPRQCSVWAQPAWGHMKKLPVGSSPQVANGCIQYVCRSVRALPQKFLDQRLSGLIASVVDHCSDGASYLSLEIQRAFRHCVRVWYHMLGQDLPPEYAQPLDVTSLDLKLARRHQLSSASAMSVERVDPVEIPAGTVMDSMVYGCMYPFMNCKNQLYMAQHLCQDDGYWVRAVRDFNCTGGFIAEAADDKTKWKYVDHFALSAILLLGLVVLGNFARSYAISRNRDMHRRFWWMHNMTRDEDNDTQGKEIIQITL